MIAMSMAKHSVIYNSYIYTELLIILDKQVLPAGIKKDLLVSVFNIQRNPPFSLQTL
jgi:hypothetical protein